MAILSGPEIKRQIKLGAIEITPFDDRWVGPNSVDLHLGDTLLSYTKRQGPSGRVNVDHPPDSVFAIDSRAPPFTRPETRIQFGYGEGGYLLLPGKLYLGSTFEYTKTVGFVPYLDGRSSLGRLGVFCHVCAGRGDNGFAGNWTLELAVVEPVILYPGDRLFQITYHTVEGLEQQYYAGRYQGDRTPVGSKINK